MLLAARPENILATARAVALRHGNRGNAQNRAFHGSGHGAGISDILGGILAAIDAGQDQIGRRRHDMFQGHDHAIGRRAVDAPSAVLVPLHPQRIVDGQRIAGTAAVAIR